MRSHLDRTFIVRLALTLALVAAVAGGSSAWAIHNYSDVPDGSFFGPAINEGAAAGCYTGFNDGTFRPASNANRGQFAFWLTNCGPRTVESDELITLAVGASDQVADVTVAGPAKGSGSGYLLIEAFTSFGESGPGVCDPCGGRSNIRVDGSAVSAGNSIDTFAGNGSWGNVSTGAVVPIAAGEEKTVTVWVNNFTGPNPLVAATALTVTYIPFAIGPATESAPAAPPSDPDTADALADLTGG